MKGIRRSLGVAQVQKAPILANQLRTLVQLIPDDLLGHRDRALLLLGFAMAARRSELIGLDVNDLEFTADGLVVNIKKSKTDQEGQGRKLGVPYGSTPLTCPVRAVRAWLDAANIKDGPLFRAVGRWGHVQTRRLEAKAVLVNWESYTCHMSCSRRPDDNMVPTGKGKDSPLTFQ
jgi:site-specific recombinase XerC